MLFSKQRIEFVKKNFPKKKKVPGKGQNFFLTIFLLLQFYCVFVPYVYLCVCVCLMNPNLVSFVMFFRFFSSVHSGLTDINDDDHHHQKL